MFNGDDLYFISVASPKETYNISSSLYKSADIKHVVEQYADMYGSGTYLDVVSEHQVKKPIGEILMFFQHKNGDLGAIGHVSAEYPEGRNLIGDIRSGVAQGVSLQLAEGRGPNVDPVTGLKPVVHRRMFHLGVVRTPAWDETSWIKRYSNYLGRILADFTTDFGHQVGYVPESFRSSFNNIRDQWQRGHVLDLAELPTSRYPLSTPQTRRRAGVRQTEDFGSPIVRFKDFLVENKPQGSKSAVSNFTFQSSSSQQGHRTVQQGGQHLSKFIPYPRGWEDITITSHNKFHPIFVTMSAPPATTGNDNSGKSAAAADPMQVENPETLSTPPLKSGSAEGLTTPTQPPSPDEKLKNLDPTQRPSADETKLWEQSLTPEEKQELFEMQAMRKKAKIEDSKAFEDVVLKAAHYDALVQREAEARRQLEAEKEKQKKEAEQRAIYETQEKELATILSLCSPSLGEFKDEQKTFIRSLQDKIRKEGMTEDERRKVTEITVAAAKAEKDQNTHEAMRRAKATVHMRGNARAEELERRLKEAKQIPPLGSSSSSSASGGGSSSNTTTTTTTTTTSSSSNTTTSNNDGGSAGVEEEVTSAGKVGESGRYFYTGKVGADFQMLISTGYLRNLGIGLKDVARSIEDPKLTQMQW